MSRKPTKTALLYQADCLRLATFEVGCLLKVLPKKQTLRQALRDISYLVTHKDSDGFWTSSLRPGPTTAPGGPTAGKLVMLVDKDLLGNGPVRVVVLYNSAFFLMPPHLLEKI